MTVDLAPRMRVMDRIASDLSLQLARTPHSLRH